MSDAAFEEAVEVAASLVTAGHRSGHRIRLRSTDGVEIKDSADRRCMNRLADIEQVSEQTAVMLGRPGGPLVVVSGGAYAAELAAMASTISRACVIVDLSATGAARELPGVRVLAAADAAEAVGLWNATVR
jgi:uncharacterized protein (DUF58 family)